jgi:hypothetical protein
MAFILVFILLKMEAYSSMHCQIVVLHLQSNHRTSKAAMQRLHDVWQNLGRLFRMFRRAVRSASLFLRDSSYFASAE